jgi:hypothetical protein
MRLIVLAPPSTVRTEPGAPSSQKRANGIGRWSPAVSGAQRAKVARTVGASAARWRSAYMTPSCATRRPTLSSLVACHGR